MPELELTCETLLNLSEVQVQTVVAEGSQTCFHLCWVYDLHLTHVATLKNILYERTHTQSCVYMTQL